MKEEEDFLNGCNDCFMTQGNSRSTFGKCRMSGNTLDLVLTSDPERILEVDYAQPLRIVRIGHATFGLIVENESY